MIEALVVKTKLEEEEVEIVMVIIIVVNFIIGIKKSITSIITTIAKTKFANFVKCFVWLSFSFYFFCQLLLAYDDFYAKYPDGEINKEQFMEVSKVEPSDDDDANSDDDGK